MGVHLATASFSGAARLNGNCLFASTGAGMAAVMGYQAFAQIATLKALNTGEVPLANWVSNHRGHCVHRLHPPMAPISPPRREK